MSEPSNSLRITLSVDNRHESSIDELMSGIRAHLVKRAEYVSLVELNVPLPRGITLQKIQSESAEVRKEWRGSLILS